MEITIKLIVENTVKIYLSGFIIIVTHVSRKYWVKYIKIASKT